ncbi:MAG: ribonuclease P protein component [Treponema sp.]|nr:ribonuclease P protein component [Treponema sp.]
MAGTLKNGFRFPKKERLKGRDEIKAVFNRQGPGRAVSCQGAKLIVLKNGLDYNRIAFTFPRKFGSAVERNRSRRISREAYRHLRHFIKSGWDLVLLVYPSVPRKKPGEGPQTAGFLPQAAQLRELLSRARLLKNPAIPAV